MLRGMHEFQAAHSRLFSKKPFVWLFSLFFEGPGAAPVVFRL